MICIPTHGIAPYLPVYPYVFFFLFVCTSLFTIKSLSNQMCHVEDTRHLSLQEQGKQHGDFLILNTR